MIASKIIKDYLRSNGITQIFIANKINMPAELLRRSLDGTRALKADEFISICKVLSLDLNYFSEKQKLPENLA